MMEAKEVEDPAARPLVLHPSSRNPHLVCARLPPRCHIARARTRAVWQSLLLLTPLPIVFQPTHTRSHFYDPASTQTTTTYPNNMTKLIALALYVAVLAAGTDAAGAALRSAVSTKIQAAQSTFLFNTYASTVNYNMCHENYHDGAKADNTQAACQALCEKHYGCR